MDDIGRYLILTQLLGDIEPLFLGEIRDTAHPRSEAPQGEHGAFAGDVGILIENVLWRAEEEEEIHLLICHKDAVGAYIGGSEIESRRRTGM